MLSDIQARGPHGPSPFHCRWDPKGQRTTGVAKALGALCSWPSKLQTVKDTWSSFGNHGYKLHHEWASVWVSHAYQQAQGRQSRWEAPATVQIVWPIANPEVQCLHGWCFCGNKEVCWGKKKDEERRKHSTFLLWCSKEWADQVSSWVGKLAITLI